MGSGASTSKNSELARQSSGAPPSAEMAGFDDVFTELFGAELLGKSGNVKTSEALAGKVVGIYFSAHWCPPCRGFTPALAKAYETYKAAGKNFEIVFASSDRDEKSFAEYYGEQPWLSLPFAARDVKEKLSTKFKVRGIPTLVILDESGATITTDGRTAVMEDPTGAAFPWRPKPLSELMGGALELDGQGGKKVPAAELESKHLLLYFSAHWCPPCRGFTPTLAERYKAYKAAGKDMELVFVSSDKDEAQFAEYFGEMPWLALPFADRERKEALSKFFEVQGIPSLVVLGPVNEKTGEREVINKNARGAVDGDATGENFPWAPAPLENLAVSAECNGSDINETPALIMLMEGCDDDTQAEMKAAMNTVAVELAAAGKAKGEPDAICFFAVSGDGVVGRVRELTKLKTPGDEPTLLMLDIPDQGGFYVAEDTDLNVEKIRAFLAAHKSGALKPKRKQLG